MYDARQITNWFIERAAKDNRRLSIMSLLKLDFIAHGWHLDLWKSPLFINRIEAWKYGPVIPDVYNSFRGQGVAPSEVVPVESARPISEAVKWLLDFTYTNYGKMTAMQLSDLTHEPGGPWDIATKKWGYFAPIPDQIIRAYYEGKRREAGKQLQ